MSLASAGLHEAAADEEAPKIEERELKAAPRAPLRLPVPVTALAWSEALRLLAVAYDWGQRVRIFDAAGEVRQESTGIYSNLPNSLLFLDGKRILVTAAMEEGTDVTDAAMSLWDIGTGRVVGHIPGPFPGGDWRKNRALAFAGSANGQLSEPYPERI